MIQALLDRLGGEQIRDNAKVRIILHAFVYAYGEFCFVVYF